MIRKILFLFISLLIISFIGCVAASEGTIDGEYEVAAVSGLSSSYYVGEMIKFEDGYGYEYDDFYDDWYDYETFEYSMTDSTVKIKNSSSSYLTNGVYKAYFYQSQLILYDNNFGIEKYRFDIR